MMQRTTGGARARVLMKIPWWSVFLAGIAAIVMGVVLLAAPGATVLFVVQMLGWYFLIMGFLSIVTIFTDRSGWAWKLVSGLFGIAAGVVVIQNYLWSSVILTTTLALVVGGLGIATGLFEIAKVFKGAHWGFAVLGGLAIVLGLVIMFNSLVSGFLLIMLTGVAGVGGGLMAIVASFGLRKKQRS